MPRERQKGPSSGISSMDPRMCDGTKPRCRACVRLSLDCSYLWSGFDVSTIRYLQMPLSRHQQRLNPRCVATRSASQSSPLKSPHCSEYTWSPGFPGPGRCLEGYAI
ncbi:uncharacterized protein BP01DRAFT_192128 [Aspergillus saccharolyticus JOP 1030-1]|uniref:Uncharacterized protein n=1 Tax=Aspergillus saccharolyticus JOP 1030-1 TaxID=1450539 RepID=A0A318ZZQ7_9EURO|nr:hypothetical protein BP01DRAFT_192128 [Aspergillus saccharolyticus JOP 1030-1]PYH40852.1 hypothetical protein BP01DRAFT_192128 [Aspergillus saccharolyticus JOP 1030-1]